MSYSVEARLARVEEAIRGLERTNEQYSRIHDRMIATLDDIKEELSPVKQIASELEAHRKQDHDHFNEIQKILMVEGRDRFELDKRLTKMETQQKTTLGIISAVATIPGLGWLLTHFIAGK